MAETNNNFGGMKIVESMEPDQEVKGLHIHPIDNMTFEPDYVSVANRINNVAAALGVGDEWPAAIENIASEGPVKLGPIRTQVPGEVAGVSMPDLGTYMMVGSAIVSGIGREDFALEESSLTVRLQSQTGRRVELSTRTAYELDINPDTDSLALRVGIGVQADISRATEG